MLHMTFYSLPFTPERPQATEARLEKIYEAAKFGLKGDSLALAAGLTPAQYRRLSEFDPLVEMAEMKGSSCSRPCSGPMQPCWRGATSWGWTRNG